MTIEDVEFMPDKLADNVMYISERFQLAIHVCPCKCGIKAVTPLGSDGWTMTRENGLVSLSPSLLNPCGTHYFIKNSSVVWA